MTADLTEFEALSAPRRTECTVKKLLADLDGQELADFKAALDAPHITHAAISQWLKNRGHQLSGHTVGRHRKGACSCA